MNTMTEDQAKKRWCPFGRLYLESDVQSAVAVNQDGSGTPVTRCIAERCMAWRSIGFVDGKPGEHGYCGLAGRP